MAHGGDGEGTGEAGEEGVAEGIADDGEALDVVEVSSGETEVAPDGSGIGGLAAVELEEEAHAAVTRDGGIDERDEVAVVPGLHGADEAEAEHVIVILGEGLNHTRKRHICRNEGGENEKRAERGCPRRRRRRAADRSGETWEA